MCRQQVLAFVDRDPIVVDQAAGGGDRKVRRNLGRDLFKPDDAIQLAIDPQTAARSDHARAPVSARLSVNCEKSFLTRTRKRLFVLP